MPADKTKQLLEQLLADLYEKQDSVNKPSGASFLEAQDGQFLGKVVSDKFDSDSILNKYGPYGSRYSKTSIFNRYSDYGSHYGRNSVNNPNCATPPKLVINGQTLGYVTVNRHVANRIPTEAFLYSLENDLARLLAGNISETAGEVRRLKGESYIEAGDGTFLGKLNPNNFDTESIFNQFGEYGNGFSPSSIFNPFSKYGNQFNVLSPYNQFSTNTPRLYVSGQFVAFLTKNEIMHPRVDPDELLSWAERNVSQ